MAVGQIAAAPANDGDYSDLVDLSDAARIVAVATVRSAVAVEPERSPGLRAGAVRIYVEADIDGVIRGESGLPSRIAYLVDLPFDAPGKPPRLKKQRVIVFAAGQPQPGQLRLAAPDAQIAWSEEREARVRKIQQDLARPNAPPRITGISGAFHVAGTLPGEGETQIFLETVNGDPASLNVLRRPGQRPQWAVAFGEILDESARVPAPGTLGWHRLACGLPGTLPQPSVSGLDPRQAEVVREDYRFILASLGPCRRASAG